MTPQFLKLWKAACETPRLLPVTPGICQGHCSFSGKPDCHPSYSQSYRLLGKWWRMPCQHAGWGAGDFDSDCNVLPGWLGTWAGVGACGRKAQARYIRRRPLVRPTPAACVTFTGLHTHTSPAKPDQYKHCALQSSPGETIYWCI